MASTPNLTDEARGDAWQHFYESRDHHELASRLNGLGGIPSEAAASLVEAKRRSLPPEHPAITAMHHMATIPVEVLDAAEKHPTVLKALVDSIQQK